MFIEEIQIEFEYEEATITGSVADDSRAGGSIYYDIERVVYKGVELLFDYNLGVYIINDDEGLYESDLKDKLESIYLSEEY